MKRSLIPAALVTLTLSFARPAASQEVTSTDPVIQKILAEGMKRSELYHLAQPLLDSIGPRLTGSRAQKQANDWMLATYKRWGIPARSEGYGTWNDWERGPLHVDLISPRVRSLEAVLMTYSPGTNGPIEGPTILLPPVKDAAEFDAWLLEARGRFVLLSYAEPSCRPDANWKEFASREAFDQMDKERNDARTAWSAGRRKAGITGRTLFERLENAGALGALILLRDPRWPLGWGVSRVGTATAVKIPEVGFSCEDYGLLFRLAQRNQNPVIRLDAKAESFGEAPVANIIAEMRGKGKPDEIVMLSAHLDSWDAAAGATDNGAGTVMMMEAMRILREVYPNPRRTIIVGHWNGEEQGLNGSAAFAADHPQIIDGLQALFNADNGTGRIDSISAQGFAAGGDFLRRWLSRMLDEISNGVGVIESGERNSGTDDASFTCHGAPAFGLSSRKWDYQTYTWHTNRDTFDKLVFDDLKLNATMIAMLAYLASEDANRMPHQTTASAKCAAPVRATPPPGN